MHLMNWTYGETPIISVGEVVHASITVNQADCGPSTAPITTYWHFDGTDLHPAENIDDSAMSGSMDVEMGAGMLVWTGPYRICAHDASGLRGCSAVVKVENPDDVHPWLTTPEIVLLILLAGVFIFVVPTAVAVSCIFGCGAVVVSVLLLIPKRDTAVKPDYSVLNDDKSVN